MHPKDFAIYRRIISLIKFESVMVLSTMDKSVSIPWSAPVYFLYDRKLFYFLSSPKSCHISQSIDAKVAVSIFSQAKCWSEIQGIQMLGKVTRIKKEQIAREITKKYFIKFGPFNDLLPFSKIKKTGISSYLLKKFNTGLYSFKPHKAIYTDNNFGFGFKKNMIIRKKY